MEIKSRQEIWLKKIEPTPNQRGTSWWSRSMPLVVRINRRTRDIKTMTLKLSTVLAASHSQSEKHSAGIYNGLPISLNGGMVWIRDTKPQKPLRMNHQNNPLQYCKAHLRSCIKWLHMNQTILANPIVIRAGCWFDVFTFVSDRISYWICQVFCLTSRLFLQTSHNLRPTEGTFIKATRASCEIWKAFLRKL